MMEIINSAIPLSRTIALDSDTNGADLAKSKEKTAPFAYFFRKMVQESLNHYSRINPASFSSASGWSDTYRYSKYSL